jgi:hypothetical protein
MSSLFHPNSSIRIFATSGIITLVVLGLVFGYLGWSAMLVTLVLIMIEVTFSFDNAIVNAKVLATLSPFWQKMFITVGMLIAVFGMRIVFPILVVMLTSGLGWGDVVHLALYSPSEYAEHLTKAHVGIASFGGMFLLMLALQFFFDPERKIHWIERIERPLQRTGSWLFYTGVSLVTLAIVTLLPFNHESRETFVAGIVGIGVYLVIHFLTSLFNTTDSTKQLAQKVGVAGFIGFIYLEVLDASFSFDGVIGAFAITNDVILIAAGLGVGALWVRSLTIFMVRRKLLDTYRFLEHGAHYTIGILAGILLFSLFKDIPEYITGSVGVIVIGLAIYSSIRAAKSELLG